jgi:hypothetical protein
MRRICGSMAVAKMYSRGVSVNELRGGGKAPVND